MLAWQLAAAGATVPQPLTTHAMRATVAAQLQVNGASAVRQQPFSGIPYKVYAAEAGRAGLDPLAFVAWSAMARGDRILAAGLGLSLLTRLLARLGRFYPLYLVGLLVGFTAGLAAVVGSWN